MNTNVMTNDTCSDYISVFISSSAKQGLTLHFKCIALHLALHLKLYCDLFVES